MDHLIRLLDNEGQGEVAMQGGSAGIANYGGVYPYRGQGVLFRSEDQTTGQTLVMIFRYQDFQFWPWRLNYLDGQSQTVRDIHEFDPQTRRWFLKYVRREVRFVDRGEVLSQTVYDPVYIRGPRTVAVPVEDRLYAVSLDRRGQVTGAVAVLPERIALPPIRWQGPQVSLVVDEGGPRALNTDHPCRVFSPLTRKNRAEVGRALVKAGMGENVAAALCSRFLKEGESITVVGPAFFKGDPKELREGNYTVCGQLSRDGGDKIGYQAEYRSNRLVRVLTGDDAVYDGFEKQTFRLTLTGSKPRRTYVGIYSPAGTLKSATLHLDDLGCGFDTDEWYRARPDTMQALGQTLARGKPADSALAEHGSARFLRTPTLVREELDGFFLQDPAREKKYGFTLAGFPLASLDETRNQTVVTFPQRFQSRHYRFARYGDLQAEELTVAWPVENEAATLFTDDRGVLHCEFTRSTPFKTIQKTWTIDYPPPAN